MIAEQLWEGASTCVPHAHPILIPFVRNHVNIASLSSSEIITEFYSLHSLRFDAIWIKSANGESMSVGLLTWTPLELQINMRYPIHWNWMLSCALNINRYVVRTRTQYGTKSHENDTESNVIPGWSSELNCSNIQRTAWSKLAQLCHLSEWMLLSVAHTGTHQFRLDRHTTTISNRQFNQASSRHLCAGIRARERECTRAVQVYVDNETLHTAYVNAAHRFIPRFDLVCDGQ